MVEQGDRQLLVEKLRQINKSAHGLQPSRAMVHSPQVEDPYIEDITLVDILATFARLKAVLQRFGLTDQVLERDSILEKNKTDLLFKIQDPPPWEGEYLIVRELIDLVENLIFAFSDDPPPLGANMRSNYYLLINLLQGLERTFTVSHKYPTREADFHELAEVVLISAFPMLKHNPTIAQTIKDFKPDTGIPETKTLIEYKYIDDMKKVPTTVDALFADAIGYLDPQWNNLICVIYETERFCTEEAWREEMNKVPRAEIVLIRGTTAKQVETG